MEGFSRKGSWYLQYSTQILPSLQYYEASLFLVYLLRTPTWTHRSIITGPMFLFVLELDIGPATLTSLASWTSQLSAKRSRPKWVETNLATVGSAHRELCYKDLVVFHYTQFEPQFLNRRSVRLHDGHLELASPASKNNPLQQTVMPTMSGTAMKQLFQEWPVQISILLY